LFFPLTVATSTKFVAAIPSNLRSPTLRNLKKSNYDAIHLCFCDECNAQALNAAAGDYSCGQRIDWLLEVKHLSELDACRRVTQDEFRDV
jgi:hypothetical protein